MNAAALVLLGALWGASFLFMRMGADAFGAMALAGMRALIGGACFLPLFMAPERRAEWRAHWKPILLVGITNSALPFVLFSLAAKVLPAGLSSIFDAITPLLVAASGWLWLSEKLSAQSVAGLLLGLIGVVWLVGDSAFAGSYGANAVWAMAACIGATVCYAFSVHYSHRRLRHVSPLTAAASSQIVAAAVLLPTTIWLWPAVTPTAAAWGAMIGLAVACTSVAYVLFFHLIAQIGTTRTMTVLYLIPAFGVLWGWWFLREAVTPGMISGCMVILAGVALTLGPVRTKTMKPVVQEPV